MYSLPFSMSYRQSRHTGKETGSLFSRSPKRSLAYLSLKNLYVWLEEAGITVTSCFLQILHVPLDTVFGVLKKRNSFTNNGMSATRAIHRL